MANREDALVVGAAADADAAAVIVIGAHHVPGDGEAGVARGLGGNAAAQTDGAGLLHGHVRLHLLHLQTSLCLRTEERRENIGKKS